MYVAFVNKGVPSLPLKWASQVAIVITSLIGRLSWVNLIWLAEYSQLADYSVRLQLYGIISENLSIWCTNHVWESCNGYD